MKKQQNYLVCAAVILAIAFLMSWWKGLFSVATAKEAFRILSDSFFVPAVLFMGGGLLGFASTRGTYDMLSFGVGRMMRNFLPMMDKHKYDDFYQYKVQRDEAGRKWSPHLLVSGAGAVLLALLFTALYYLVG